MVEEKRQKMMLVVLAVCMLGIGGIWVALHDWSGYSSVNTTQIAERKQRETAKLEGTRQSSRKDRTKIAENTRKQREIAQRDDSQRKSRQRKRGEKKTNKKKVVPVS